MRTTFWAWAAAAAIVCGAAPYAVAAPSARGPLPGACSSRSADRVDVGFLDISSDPSAKILVDEADTGRVTPQPHLELKAGHHRLTLVTLDGARRSSIGFNVEAGKTTKLTIHLASS